MASKSLPKIKVGSGPRKNSPKRTENGIMASKSLPKIKVGSGPRKNSPKRTENGIMASKSLPKIKVGSGLVGCSFERQNSIHLIVLKHQIARLPRKNV